MRRTTDLLPADQATRIVNGAQRTDKKDSESHGIPSSRKKRSKRFPEDILKVTQNQEQQKQKSRSVK